MLHPLSSPPPGAEATQSPKMHSRAVVWARVVLVYGCLEGALWSVRSFRGIWALAAATLIASFLVCDLLGGYQRVRDLGIGLRGLAQGWWIPPAAAVLSGSIVLMAWRVGTLHSLFGPAGYYVHASGYALWTVVQEFIAQSFFFQQLQSILKPRKAILANGLLFAIAHWPNPILVPVTLVGGCILTGWFYRYRNIYLLAIAHTLVALSIAVSVPDNVHRHMRVGVGYEHYLPHVQHGSRRWSPTPPR